MEMIVKAGLVGIHLASGQPHVVPSGGRDRRWEPTRSALASRPLKGQ